MANKQGTNKILNPQTVEEALEEMEAKYQSMFDNAISGIFQTTPEGQYISANPALARLYGYDSPEEMMGNLQDIEHQLYVAPRRRKEFATVLRERDSVSEFESQIYRRDGKIIWISENARAVRDREGKLLYYEGFVEDITKRKQAENALKESEQRLRLLIEGVRDYALFMLDEKGKVASWNTGSQKLYGYETNEIIDRHFSCFYTPEDLKVELHCRGIKKAKATGRFEQEIVQVRGDGTKFWAHTIATALYDEIGQFQGFSMVTKDISERKQSEAVQAGLIASLQESEKKYRSLYESTSDAVMLLDEEAFLDCNRATLELFACTSKADFCGKRPDELSPALQPSGEFSLKKAKHYIAMALSEGSCRFDWRHKRLDGSEFPAEVLLTSMEFGDRLRLQAVVRDITDRVVAQEALERANSQLEMRVEERTVQLKEAIDRLREEIVERKRTEEKLRTSQEKFSKAFRSSPDPMTITTFKEGKFIEVNDSFLSVTGYQLEEVINRTATEKQIWVNPENSSQIRESLQKSGIVRNQEYEFRIKSGEVRVWLVSAEVINLGGELCLLSVMTDITERKKAGEALRESQRTLSTLMGNLPGMAYRFRNDVERSLEFVSEGCYKLTGYRPDEFLGPQHLSMSELTYPDDRHRFWIVLQSALRDRLPYHLIYRIVTKNGEVKWVWEQGMGIFSSSGELVALEGLITDITKRKRAEDGLMRSQVLLRQQKKQLEEALEQLQETQATLIHAEKMSSLGQMVAGIAHEIKNPVSCVSGNMLHLGNYTADLINLLQLYKQHFPNPPEEILEEMEELDLEFLIEDLPKVVSSTQMGAERIREIVRSLRNFSRTDEYHSSRVDIHEGIEGTLVILQSQLKPSGTKSGIKVYKEYGSLPLVECYAGKMSQVFMNLIGNAIDALREWEEKSEAAVIPTISIETETVFDACDRPETIIIRIRDNGPGMTEEVRQKLFEKFFTTKPVGKGTGLGLSISYQIVVEKHRGKLDCISAPGKGAEFVIELPVELQS
ncbi:MAG: PAS domain S-box protein [Cyanobacteriota bacterium]|nr:PAS domain S-box protein [Cyanobacteriota bacterium]